MRGVEIGSISRGISVAPAVGRGAGFGGIPAPRMEGFSPYIENRGPSLLEPNIGVIRNPFEAKTSPQTVSVGPTDLPSGPEAVKIAEEWLSVARQPQKNHYVLGREDNGIKLQRVIRASARPADFVWTRPAVLPFYYPEPVVKPKNEAKIEPNIEKIERSKSLPAIGGLVLMDKKVVVVFSRFDQLKKDFDENFLSNLQSLINIAAGKIVLIFTAIKPLDELAPEACRGGNLPFYSKLLYFTPYQPRDLKALFTLEHTLKAHPDLDEIIKLSGGHNQLLHIFINSHKKNNLLLDKFVKLQLKDLYDYLDYTQKKQVAKIASGKNIEDIDEYLLGVGYVTILSERSESKDLSYKLFSPVLAEYIKTNLPHKLSVKESKLFKLLRNNFGKVVSKDEIFKEVWGEDQEASDWALDALIYRLRNSTFMKSHGYVIESHKKVGYTLIQP